MSEVAKFPIPSDPAPNGYVAHPFEAEQAKTLEYYKSVSVDTEGWIDIGSTKDIVVKMDKKPQSDSPIPIMRGRGIIKGVKLHQITPMLIHPGARAVWDERFEEGFALERYSRRAYKFYTVQKGVWPVVSERDFVGFQAAVYEGGENDDTKLVHIVQSSVTDGSPTVKGRVRGTIFLSGWRVEQVGDDVDLTYLVKVNPNGQLPSKLVETVMSAIPKCVYNVIKMKTDTGLIPYVIEPTPGSVFRIESYSHKGKSTYNLAMIAKGGDKFNIFIDSEVKYKNGYSLTIEGDAKSGTTATEGKDAVTVEYSPEADGKHVTFVITAK